MSIEKMMRRGSTVYVDGRFYDVHFRERVSTGSADDLVGLTYVPLSKSKRSRLSYMWMSELEELERNGRAIIVASNPGSDHPHPAASKTSPSGGAHAAEAVPA